MLGFIGSGNMARALARGWGEPVLASDSGSGRARAMVRELGGEAIASNAEVAKRADSVVLCHKPYQLEEVAAEVAPHATHVISVLGGTTLAQLRAAYPEATVVLTIPNTPVEVRQGVTIIAEGEGADEARALFERVGHVFVLPERLLQAATATTGVTPAYVALLVEAHIDAAVRQGLPSALATDLAIETFAGSSALLRHRGGDTLAVRREVTSPGGSTARGLRALEHGGVRSALDDAMEAVVHG
jgi:pyrroline-5-carboxylate reductase